tara:strand:- start:162 stop:602 length:441 start_codon:yes stop_codon:yes gene_type:complete
MMNFEIGRSNDFVVKHCYSCAIPGYLIVSPLAAVKSLDALPKRSAESLGPLLTNVTSLVRQIVRPERIYCAQFGEEQSQLHFHIFPRGAALTEEYLKAFPQHASQIRGPIVLDWARDRYRSSPEEVYERVTGILTQLHEALERQQA